MTVIIQVGDARGSEWMPSLVEWATRANAKYVAGTPGSGTTTYTGGILPDIVAATAYAKAAEWEVYEYLRRSGGCPDLLPPDMEVRTTGGDGGAGDLKTQDGQMAIEVKCRTVSYGSRLLIRHRDGDRTYPLRATHYVATAYDAASDTMTLVGWVTREDFSRNARLESGKASGLYNLVLFERELEPIETMPSALRATSLGAEHWHAVIKHAGEGGAVLCEQTAVHHWQLVRLSGGTSSHTQEAWRCKRRDCIPLKNFPY